MLIGYPTGTQVSATLICTSTLDLDGPNFPGESQPNFTPSNLQMSGALYDFIVVAL